MTAAHVGSLAKDRAQSEEVKQLGEKMARESRESYEKLNQLAGQFTFSVPKSIDSDHQEIINRFENLSGEEFDREFKRYAENSAGKAEWFRIHADALANKDLTQHAGNLASRLEGYQQQARSMRIGGRQAADRPSAGAGSSAQPATEAGGTTEQIHGTVTGFEKGKRLEIKTRDRIGRHTYDLSSSNLKADVPENLQVGAHVTITERVDRNGFRSLEVTMDQAESADRPESNK